MKIIDLTEFYSDSGGGVRTYLAAKANALASMGHQHWVMAPGSRDQTIDMAFGSEKMGHSRLLRVVGRPMPYDSNYYLLSNYRRIRELVSQIRPDVVEVHSPYLAMLAALRLPRSVYGIQTAWWHSDFIDTYFQGTLERAGLTRSLAESLLSPVWHLTALAYNHVCQVSVASKKQAEKLSRHGIIRVTRVPFGIDPTVFSPTAFSQSRHDALGRGAKHVFVAIGRLSAEKRWDVVVEAYTRLVRTRDDVALVFVGEGPELVKLRSATKQLPAVYFEPFVSSRTDMASILASADALVHACPYETFGLSVAEALACGTPVFVPDQGSASEFVTPESGYIYRALDCQELFESMLNYLDNKRPQMSAAALKASKYFLTNSEHFSQVLSSYEHLIHDGSRATPAAGTLS